MPSGCGWPSIPPEHERRLRLHVPEFATATKQAGHGWQLIDVTTSFEKWMANDEYRDTYFKSPELLDPALAETRRDRCRSIQWS